MQRSWIWWSERPRAPGGVLPKRLARMLAPPAFQIKSLRSNLGDEDIHTVARSVLVTLWGGPYQARRRATSKRCPLHYRDRRRNYLAAASAGGDLPKLNLVMAGLADGVLIVIRQ